MQVRDGGHRGSAGLSPPPPPHLYAPPPDTMGRHTDTTRQSLMGAAGATNLTPQHTARSPLPKTAHGGREEGDTGISISIVSPPPHTPRNTEAQQKHTARSRLCSCRGGGDIGESGGSGLGGRVGWEGRGQHAGLGPCRMRWHRDAEQRGDPHTAHRGMGGGCTLLGALLESSSWGETPTPARGSMGRELPATFLGTQQKEWGCEVTSQPRGQTANSREPPRHAKQERGNEPLPPRGSRGAAGQPPPHPLAALSTYWLSSLAACKERERGTAPPALEAPRWARGGAGRASDPHGGGLGAARSLWGAAGQQRTDRRTRDGHSFPPRGNEGGRPRAPDPPHPHGRGRTNSHGRTQRPTVRRGGTVGLPHSVGATPQRSKGALQRLVAAVLGLDELEDEEEDGLHAEHQHHAAHKAGRVEARRLELGAARQRGARGAAPYGTEWGYGDGP